MSDQNSATGRRWAWAGAGVGITVSILANIGHSFVPPASAPAGWHPNGGAIGAAAFWPVSLLLALEIMVRVPWPAGAWLAVARYGGLGVVATVAAIVSYGHMSALLESYGENGWTVHLGPVAVDGLMVVATAALLATRTAAPVVVTRVDTPPVKQVDTPVKVAMSAVRQPAKKVDNAPRVAKAHRDHPDMTDVAMAKMLAVSVRTVRRHRPRRPTAVSA